MSHIHPPPTLRGSRMTGFHHPNTVVTMTRYTAPNAMARTTPFWTFSTVSPTSSYFRPVTPHTVKTTTM